jgi:hypothetical protein
MLPTNDPPRPAGSKSTGKTRLTSEAMQPSAAQKMFAFLCLAKLAEFFAQSFLTKPESVEEEFPRGSFLPLSERRSQN